MTLGRGLSALFGEVSENTISTIDIDYLIPNRNQPRKFFDIKSLNSLASSIAEKGVLQPIVVRILNDKYEIVAGERRFRAAQIAGLSQIPVCIIDCSDNEIFEIALIENLQREDLNPIEEAESLSILIENHYKTQEDVAKIIGKSRSYVANILRILNLPEETKQIIREGKISAGHARALTQIPNHEILIDNIVKEKMTVRDLENIIKNKKKSCDDNQNQDIKFLAEKMSSQIGMKSKIKINNKGGGVISINFANTQQLEHLLQTIMQKY